jgi:hypothetical protein
LTISELSYKKLAKLGLGFGKNHGLASVQTQTGDRK